MKIRRVLVSNRMKAFRVESGDRVYTFPFSRLRLKPSSTDPIADVRPDEEIGRDGFTYLLRSGKTDTILLDQVLDYNRDSEYLRRLLLYKLSVQARELIEKRKLCKREIIRRLGTTPAHFYRLLNQACYTKTIDQMVRLLAALDCQIDLVVRKAA